MQNTRISGQAACLQGGSAQLAATRSSGAAPRPFSSPIASADLSVPPELSAGPFGVGSRAMVAQGAAANGLTQPDEQHARQDAQQDHRQQQQQQQQQAPVPPAASGGPLPALIVRQACELLALPPRVTSTALTYLHRLADDNELTPEVRRLPLGRWTPLAACLPLCRPSVAAPAPAPNNLRLCCHPTPPPHSAWPPPCSSWRPRWRRRRCAPTTC